MPPAPFTQIPGHDFQAILEAGVHFDHPEGTTLFSLGDIGDSMYIIEDGAVELRFAPTKGHKVLTSGAAFGEVGLLAPNQRRTATAVCIESTKVRRISEESMDTLQRHNPRALCSLLRVTCSYLVDSEQAMVTELMRTNAELEDRVRRRTRELAEANGQLMHLDKQKDELLGMAAHDLRSPLTSILASAQLLLPEGLITDREERGRFLSRIERVSRKMLHLLDTLLDITKIQSGNIRLNRESISLDALLEDVLELNGIIGLRKGITLKVESAPDIGSVNLDFERIEEVLNNLISNAFKFSSSGSSVVVRVLRRDGHVRLEVTDEGPGIPEQEIGQIFTEFKKTSVQPTAGETGAGLGLAICKRLVELHEGRIGIDSEVGKGSTFWMELPS